VEILKSVLVVAPHPDDDVIACGGSIAKHCHAGHQVTIMYMTSGEAGGIHYEKEELGILREEEARQAATLLGVNDLVFLRMADGYIEFNRKSLVLTTKAIREIKPDWVYIPHSHDGNLDHQITNQLITEACHRAASPFFQECCCNPWSVELILGYEIWTPLSKVAYTEDVTEFMELKIKAIRKHQSQLRYYRYDEGIKGLNRYRGIMTGKAEYCEAFEIIRNTTTTT